MRSLFIVIFCIFTLQSFSQPSEADSIRSSYFSSNANTLPIYNGRVFLNSYAAIKGSAFFGNTNWTDGSVEFDHTWYYHIPLLYDAYRQELIVKHPSGNAIVLFGERVQAFSFDKMNFVRLTLDEKNAKSGFYQVLAPGNFSILVKRWRLLDERIADNAWHREFLDRHTYFTWKDGVHTSFQKSKQLLKIVKQSGKNIVADLKNSNIKFKSDPEPYMIRVAELYNQ